MKIDFVLSTPESWVTAELHKRSERIRDPNNTWAASRNPWIRMVSNAVIIKNGEEDSTSRITNILKGGSSKDTFSDVYNGSSVDKFRPIPGINSVDIKFKGTMGSTMSALIKFQCWTKSELEILEKLYMTPGISIVVEWGWSVTSDGSIIVPLNIDRDLQLKSQGLTDIQNKIHAKRKDANGNYDGFVGIVSNFNWRLNEQTAYDCEVELITEGELWFEQNASLSSTNAQTDTNDAVKKLSNLQYAFDYFYTNCKDPVVRKTFNDKTKLLMPAVNAQKWETETREYDKKRMDTWDSVVEGSRTLLGTAPNYARDEIYISWGEFIRTVNNYINIYVDGKRTDSDNSFPRLAMDVIPVSVPPLFMSADPRICTFKLRGIEFDSAKQTYYNTKRKKMYTENLNSVKGLNPESNLDKLKFMYETAKQVVQEHIIDIQEATDTVYEDAMFTKGTFSDPVVDMTSIVSTLEQIEYLGDDIDREASKDFDKRQYSENTGFLNNIYINAGYLRDCIAAGEFITTKDFLDKVLSDILIATGNIWDLVTFIEGNRVHIYDASYVNESIKVEPAKIDLADNIARNINIESKLVEGYKTMMLYGHENASPIGNTSNTNVGIKVYTDTVEDRVRIKKNTEYKPMTELKTPGDDLVPIQYKETSEESLQKAYYLLCDSVDSESTDSAKNSLSNYISEITTIPEKKVDLPRNNNILLPINFSLTMDGISGFRWGNAIMFDYLPSKYKDKINLQIIKVDHTISAESWTTTLETVMKMKTK
jgi:hypothetical protein